MATRTMSPTTWNKQFAKRLREHLGVNYPIPREDWSTAEFWRTVKGKSPTDAADELANNRLMAVPERLTCKAWFDEHDGGFHCEPCVPPAVLITIRAAVDGGCTHGTAKHWENAFPQFHHLQDVRPVLYLWELL